MGKFHEMFNPFDCLDSCLLIASFEGINNEVHGYNVYIFEFIPNQYILVMYGKDQSRIEHDFYEIRYWRGTLKYCRGMLRNYGPYGSEEHITKQLRDKGLL